MASKEPNTAGWVEAYNAFYGCTFFSRSLAKFQQYAFFDFVANRNSAVLDVGCGEGSFLRKLRRYGFDNAIGIEPDVRLVPQDMADVITIGSGLALPFESGRFDVVFYSGVLHHFNDRDEYVQAISEGDRVLKPGGLMIFLEPDWAWLHLLAKVISGWTAPILPVARAINKLLSDEWPLLSYFFANQSVFVDWIKERNYVILRDRRIVYKWIFTARKPSGTETGVT